MSNFDQGIGSVTYPGIQQIVSANYSRSHGITPDVCQIEMAPQPLSASDPDYTPIEPDGYLLFQFDEYTNGGLTGRTQILLQGCRPDKASVRRSATSINWTIPIYDRRWKWKYGSFSGHWNIKKNGVIEPRKKKTPRQLADMCLEAMGEKNYDTRDLLDLEKKTSLPYRNQIFPEVHWDRIPPAQALNELVTPLGYRVCLGWDDRVRIRKYGEGALLPTEDLMSGGFEANLPETPDSVTVLGGISMHEVLWELEDVGLDIDGDALWPCSFEQKQMFEKVREVREARNSHAVRMADDCYAGCWAIPGTSGNSDGLLHWWADWDEDGTACEKYPSKAGYPRKAGWTGMIVHKPKAGYCLECMRIYEGDTLPVEICGTWIVTMMGVNATG